MGTPLRKNDIVTLGELEYVLKRPHIYIGSVKEEKVKKFLYDDKGYLVEEEIPFIPGLVKIFEEVLDNAIDEAIETEFEYADEIDVSIDKDGVITVRDNGRGLPIVKEKNSERYVTEVIFTDLRTGSNFDDEKRSQVEKKGMNGVGVSLTNIFSEWFEVKTANGLYEYSQRFELGPVKKHTPKIKETRSNNHFTEVKFKPNYAYYEPSDEFMKILPRIVFQKVKNSAFCFPEITFRYNGKQVRASNLGSFMKYLSEDSCYNETEKVRLGIFSSLDGFQQISFVNGLETVRGGTHVDYVVDYIVQYLREYIKKKHKFDLRPADIKNKLFIVLNVRLCAPDFDTQTKERLITQPSAWNGRIKEVFTDAFVRSIVNNKAIIEPIIEAHKFKKQLEENLELKKINQNKKREKIRVEKYLPATKNHKWLVLTEGDSAKGGISGALGREDFSYFPLRGKPINAYEAKPSVITKNKEILDIVNILGLRLDKDKQENMRYKNVLIATDQDADGIHIRALLMAFFGRFAPSLFKNGRIHYLQTPLIAARKNGKITGYWFDVTSFNQVKDKYKNHQITYYKGLGTWSPKDLSELIKREGIEKFIVTIKWEEKSNVSFDEWIGSNSELRKKHLRGKSFDIEAI